MGFAWSKEMVDRFAEWYVADGPLAMRAVRRLPQYEAFFLRLETLGGCEGLPDSASLFEHWRVDELRRHKVPMRFLRDVYGLVLDNTEKAEHAERTRILDLLATARPTNSFTLIKRYVDWLRGRGKLARTIRLYASAANALCMSLELSLSAAPDRTAFERYLHNHLGQRTNLSVFVSYCRQELGWDVSMPTHASSATHPAPGDPILRELDALLERIRRGIGDQQVQRERAIALLLGFEDLRLCDVQWTIGRRSGRPLSFSWGAETVRLPRAVADLAAEWLQLSLQRDKR